MGIERLIRDGWFDKNDIDIKLTSEEIDRIRNFEDVVVTQDNKKYLIRLRSKANIKKLEERDVLIYEV